MIEPAAANIQRLRRILEVEESRGCVDRTVIGGLDTLLRNLMIDRDGSPVAAIEAVVLALGGGMYAALDEQARRAWIERARTILSGSRAPASPGARSSGAPTAAGANSVDVRRPETMPVELAATPPAAAGTVRKALPGHSAATPPPATAPSTTVSPAPDRPRATAVPTNRVGERTRPRKRGDGPTLDSPVSDLPGVGPARAGILAKLDILRVRDLLFHFPARHDDYSRIVPVSELRVGEQQTVVARVWSATVVATGPAHRKSTEMIAGDESGNIRVIFFNNPYPAARLRTNQRVTLSGRVSLFKGQRQFENPEWEIIDEGGDLDAAIHTGRLVPVYPLTQGIQNRALRLQIHAALEQFAPELEDPLPGWLRDKRSLPEFTRAVRQAHYPDSLELLETARRRLAYDELLTLQLSVQARRMQRVQSTAAMRLPLPRERRHGFLGSLPFALTSAQVRAIDAVTADLETTVPMARLLQGDVGSGKTVVAAVALLAAAANDGQSVIMAPTEILADQHFRTLCRLLGGGVEAADDAALFECSPGWLGRPLRIAMLRGSMRAKAKREVQEAIGAGLVDIAVGTQALIQGGVTFQRLVLTVVDEQHRFGVAQRSALAGKGGNTHLLVMTATPIPRTLALSLYGDLEITVIDELPPGRMPIRTRVVEPRDRENAYRFVRAQVERGFQAFVICPLVEESDALEVRAATEEYERLRIDVFPDLAIGLLHGRMAPAEKDAVMRAFRDWETSVLVSTAVVEVGIDIPRATVIMIEDADRFGLAQLHQFRGRVGRGGDQAYCLLLSESPSAEAQARLRLLEETHDGMKLAEQDLRLRGPGDYFGTRQSGMATLKLARLGDLGILEAARDDAAAVLTRDPGLAAPEFAGLRRRVVEMAVRAGDAN